MLPELKDIARRRKALGLTQAKLAKEIGKGKEVSRSLIAKLETGRISTSYKQAKLIFDTLENLEKMQGVPPRLKYITIDQIHNSQIEFAYAYEPVSVVWKRMEKTTYSQFPVKDGDKIVGSVTERGINRRIMEGDPEEVKKLPVREVMEDPFPTLSMNTPVAAVMGLLQNYQAILTVKEDKVVGIVTNTDIGKVFELPETT
jgi:predicted transcriptional regulator